MEALKWAIICCLTLMAACAFAEMGKSTAGSLFPKEVIFEYQGKPVKLQMTGEATRKKFFVSVYQVAHYLQEGAVVSGTNKFQSILNDNAIKQFTFKWLRTVEAAKVKEGYQESFKKTLSASAYAQLQDEISRFINFFKEVKSGDEYVLRWLPGGHIEVMIQGSKVGEITNLAFAKALWSIWFGDKSVVDREKLF